MLFGTEHKNINSGVINIDLHNVIEKHNERVHFNWRDIVIMIIALIIIALIIAATIGYFILQFIKRHVRKYRAMAIMAEVDRRRATADATFAGQVPYIIPMDDYNQRPRVATSPHTHIQKLNTASKSYEVASRQLQAMGIEQQADYFCLL
ncbi:unnamed protein product [Didymodactylos carnosus]|uniref:Uncharacterized protein n=1 Tax=Didymodactylos carnosus TaxID=1234261 RepID=A0A815R1K7_9BILA|nr:unnamed protein product [Didymodactylos carnosus]CAF4338537.1 unnamed protein product [Didymodactylos carnosus]